MAQIQKLKSGATIEDYNAAKSAYELAYLNADVDTRNWLDGFVLSAARYQVKDKMSDSSVRDLLTQVYTIGTQMAILGRSGYQAPAATPRASTKSWTNDYSHEENVNNANELARRYVAKNTPGASTTGTSTGASQLRPYYSYVWNDGLDSGWDFNTNENIKGKISRYATTLATNIDKMLRYKDAGYNIHGVDPSKYEEFRTVHTGLQAFLNDLNNGVYNDRHMEALLRLGEYARKVGADVASFREYFKSFLNPVTTPVDTNREGWESKGFTHIDPITLGYSLDILDYLTSRKAHLMKGPDGHSIYVFDENYSDFLKDKPLQYINTDWRTIGQDNSPYNLGLFSDADGKVWFGDVTSLTPDDEFFEAMNNFRNTLKGDRNKLFWTNHIGNMSESSNQLVQLFIERLRNSDVFATNPLVNYADVSQLFGGNSPVIAVNENGDPFSDDGDEYGQIRFKPNTKFYYLDSKNQIHEGTFKQVEDNVGAFRISGYGEDEQQIASPVDLRITGKDTDITADQYLSGRSTLGLFFINDYDENNGWPDWLNAIGNVTKYAGFPGIGPWIPMGIYNMWNAEIKDDRMGWTKKIVDLMTKSISERTSEENELLDRFKAIENPDNVLVFILDMYEHGILPTTTSDGKMDETYKKFLLLLRKRAATSRVQSEKDGGVLKAAKGAVVDVFGNNVTGDSKPLNSDEKEEAKRQELIRKASEAGYSSVSEYLANIRTPGLTGFKASDYVRLAAIAADIASIPAAFVPGHGTAVSAVLGVGSSLATLVTDITDDGFQIHDLTGLGVNLALDAAGLLGGAGKPGKIVKNLLKFGPLLLGAWGAMQNGDKYTELFDKLKKGKSLTVQDWKTLSEGVALVAGTTRAGASAYKQRVISNKAKTDSKNPEFNLKVRKNSGETEIKIKKAELEQILKAKDTDEINAIIRNVDPEASVIPTKKRQEGLKGLFKSRIDSSENPFKGMDLTDFLQIFDVSGLLGSPYYGTSNNIVNRFGRRLNLASDVDIAGGNISYWAPFIRGNKKLYTSAPSLPGNTRTTNLSLSPVKTVDWGLYEEVPGRKQGGKLDRFGEYLNSHK